MKGTTLITGSSRGIGRELALTFARNGYDIIIHGREKKRLGRLKKEITALGRKCYMTTGDITDPRTIQKLAWRAKKYAISVLVNNAGIPGDGLLGKISSKFIEKVIATNLLAPMFLTNQIYPFFLRRRKGTIININSVSGLEFQPSRPIYCASKWGLRGFAGALRGEAARYHIRIIDVFPSRVKTSPKFAFGREPRAVAESIYAFFANTKRTILILDNRPKKYRHYV